jgi:endo-1,4-beta-xylanase
MGGATAGGASAISTAPAKKFVGNITTGYAGAVDYNGLTFAHYWDQITPENAGKWGSVQSSASAAFNWSTLDSIYKYTETNQISFKEHTFVWGSQQPSGSITQANVENWIKSFCERYPNTKLIDVVNEPPPHTNPSYASALGAGESGTYGWITKAFKLARQYCGNAVLILNDYNNMEYSDQENHFIDIVNQVVAAGGPIDAVGAQSHDVNRLSASTLQANLNTMHTKTNLPIYITEYDVSNASDSGQLSTYQAQFPIMWNTDYVHGITIWGWIYGQTWSPAPSSGLVNNKTPRSAMTWLMQQLGRPVPPN